VFFGTARRPLGRFLVSTGCRVWGSDALVGLENKMRPDAIII
jgi:hypothetical protein